MIGLSRLKQLLPVLACFAAVAVQGQIGMNLTLNRTAYMQYEPVYACVTLRSRDFCSSKSPTPRGGWFRNAPERASCRSPGCCCGPVKLKNWSFRSTATTTSTRTASTG